MFMQIWNSADSKTDACLISHLMISNDVCYDVIETVNGDDIVLGVES